MSDFDLSTRPRYRETWSFTWRWGILVAGCFVILALIGWTCNWFGDVASTVQREFSFSKQFERYQWLKDTQASLTAQGENIEAYRNKIKQLQNDYTEDGVPIPARKWDRADRESLQLWRQELTGTIAAYNSLAARYNAAMAKINFRYANRGEVPPGTDPLRKQFSPYLDR